MANVDAPLEVVTIDERRLLARLTSLAETSPNGLLAFDGDGTLWSGDVGEDVFHEAVSAGLLREEARQALVNEAAAHAIETHGTPSEIAARLFEAYLAGGYPERDVCAMMTWCYAGFSRDELLELVRHAFARADLADRLHRELAPILDFAREAALRVVVVSASPQLIVEEAVSLWGVTPESVAASRPAFDSERIAPRLASPVPYAEAKPAALRALAPDHPLLAAFGDNVFDIELLKTAQLGVAVRPKPALRMRLPELKDIVVLESYH
ncbi:MAG TPA: HAD family hydrolase [Polyangiaceae bacterium]|nr:HAD family hydrolase [Polyangiaceae bacterium]